MLKISYANCLGLSPAISAQFTLEMCVAARNRERFTKPPILRFQRHWKSSMLIFLRSSSPMLVMISSMSVLICNHFYARRANNGKITFFQWGCPSFAPSFVGTPWPSGVTFCHEILETLSYHTVKTQFLSYLSLNWYPSWQTDRWTDGQTDRITVASKR